VVENRAGASGTIGTEIAARAEPDGHTLFMATMGNMTANQHLYPKMAVDPLRAFAPITKVVDVHFVFLANPALAANSVGELVELAKKRPGDIAYSSSGPGGAPHLAMELFKRQANVDLIHIPYKGSSPSISDLIGGRVMLSMDSLVQVVSSSQGGAAEGARRAWAQARRAAARGADDRRSGASRLRAHQLVRPPRACRDAKGNSLEDPCRRDPGAERSGSEKAHHGPRRRCGRQFPEEFGAAMRAESAQWAEIIKAANIRAEE